GEGLFALSAGAGLEVPDSTGAVQEEPAVRHTPVVAHGSHWRPGADVRHEGYGAGWVGGSGLGRVTVRFEGPRTQPGPVRTFPDDDPQLTAADPPYWRED